MCINRILHVTLLLVFQGLPHSCDDDFVEKFKEATSIALDAKNQFYELFDICFKTTMPNQKFISNNLHSFINYPSKTTVGYSPKFTTNRKFFANLIATVAFKNMLEKDVEEIRNDLITKMKYCDEAVMDQNLLKEYYDREVDLSRL